MASAKYNPNRSAAGRTLSYFNKWISSRKAPS